jgi:3-hydroxybutyryl-CoA dehydrogenase
VRLIETAPGNKSTRRCRGVGHAPFPSWPRPRECRMNIENIVVVGAGVIGTGVVQDLFEAGYKVGVIDVSDSVLQQARQRIRNEWRLHRLLRKGTAQRADDLLAKVVFTTDHEILCYADFVIENVTEDSSVKQKVYNLLDRKCPPKTIFAANTSAILISQIAAATNRPTQVVGMHFMNPVPLKRVVEVVRGHHTSESTIEAAKEVLRRMNKESVLVNDSPGFVSNRVLMLTINEAICLMHESVAAAEAVDRICRECFGHKMGPLETADLIGLDTVLKSIEVMCETFNDSKYRPCPLLRKMVSAGLLGRKSGRGFYTYLSDRNIADTDGANAQTATA